MEIAIGVEPQTSECKTTWLRLKRPTSFVLDVEFQRELVIKRDT